MNRRMVPRCGRAVFAPGIVTGMLRLLISLLCRKDDAGGKRQCRLPPAMALAALEAFQFVLRPVEHLIHRQAAFAILATMVVMVARLQICTANSGGAGYAAMEGAVLWNGRIG